MRSWCFAVCAAVIVLVSMDATSQAARLRIGTEEPGVATEGSSLLVALPLVNLGKAPISQVRLTSIALGTQKLVRPATLPLSVGRIAAGKDRVLQLAFRKPKGAPGSRHVLELEGTFRLSGKEQSFQVRRVVLLPRPDKGRAVARSTTLESRRVDGATLPPNHAGIRPEQMNEEEGLPLPETMLGGTIAPTNPSVRMATLPVGALADPAEGPLAVNDPLTFVRAGTDPINITGIPWDPSGTSVDVPNPLGGVPTRLVFLTGNLYALVSIDGGSTYTTLDPTTLFSVPASGLPPDQGICCDQNLIYIPSIDRFVWLLLTGGSKIGILRDQNGQPVLDSNGNQIPLFGFNRMIAASASPQQVIATGGTGGWTVWEMTTATFGFSKSGFLDYPDLSFTDNFLHISVSRADLCGLLVIRIPLGDVQNGGVIHLGFTNPQDSKVACQARLAHDVPDAAYWFGHVNNKKFSIFEWLDSSPIYTWRALEIAKWTRIDNQNNPQGDVSKTPNGTDWLTANIDSVRGATMQSDIRSGNTQTRRILTAWNAGKGGKFPQPYVRLLPVIKITLGNGPVIWSSAPGSQLWNPNFAFHHAHLATNANGEVGVSVAAGGGGSDATPMAGFIGDSTLYAVNVSSNSINRWGDYTAIRRHWPNNLLFSVSDYFLQAPAKPLTAIHQYRLFGRTADVGGTF